MAVLGGRHARPLRIVDSGDPRAVRDAIAEAFEGGPPVLPRPGGLDAAPPELVSQGLGAEWPDDAALVIETSGSTGVPKRVVLTAASLRASGTATAQRLGEVGGADVAGAQWLLSLPAEYVAGAQVLARSILANTEPVVLGPGSFTATGYADAIDTMHGGARVGSLVPAQLLRLLDAAEGVGVAEGRADAEGGTDVAARVRDAVASLDAILVGGQSTPVPARERAAALGWRLVRTYGASETAGGCVYDGVPLDGVEARDVDGEVWLAGDVLAAGYLDDPARTDDRFVRDADGRRWYRTGDAGTVTADDPRMHAGAADRQRVAISGRLDNVIISGGEKVLLDRVERLVRDVDGYGDAVVVGVPDARWGEVPVVVVAASAGVGVGAGAGSGAARESWATPIGGAAAATVDRADDLANDAGWARVRETTAAAGRAARPAHRIRLPELPRLTSGKPDRRAISELVVAAVRAIER